MPLINHIFYESLCIDSNFQMINNRNHYHSLNVRPVGYLIQKLMVYGWLSTITVYINDST